jgi:hypothetical protein
MIKIVRSNNKKWGRTSERLYTQVQALVSSLNTPPPFEVLPSPVYWPLVASHVRGYADEVSDSGRVGFLTVSAYDVELEEKAVFVYKQGHVKERDLLFTIKEV